MPKRKQHAPQFKAKVALEALKGLESASALAARFELHPSQISHWKRQLLDHAADLFTTTKNHRGNQQRDAQEAALYEQIGRLKMENEFLKKKAALFD